MKRNESAADRKLGGVLDAAFRLTAENLYVVPIPLQQKGPRTKNWQNLRLSTSELPFCFSDGSNIGLLLGVSPRRIVDVDLDCPQAVVCAGLIAGPTTERIAGRKGNPMSHYFFELQEDLRTEKYCGPNREKILELRGTGSQTVVPPSIHPTGEPILWVREAEFGKTTKAALTRWVGRVASGAVLAIHWGSPGARHDPTMALAGILALAGWAEAEVVEFVVAAATAAGDPHVKDREAEARSTCQKVAVGDRNVTQRRHLEEILGAEIVRLLAGWLQLKNSPDPIDEEKRYAETSGRICAIRFADGQQVAKPLCNFTARITEQLTLDDGISPTYAHLISGTVENSTALPTVRVPTSDYASLNWVTKYWGTYDAIIRAGWNGRDQLREAIQLLSLNAPKRHIFTHTGWRHLDNKWIFLHSGGAVNGENAEVDLGSSDLIHYRLPAKPENLVEAVRCSLSLLGVANESVTVPLWAAMFRAPLASFQALDLSVWLEGPTGSMKSTLAALFLSHYGVFERTALPGSWTSTGNQLEKRASILKDVPFVIDDYAPSAHDARELELKAARVLRSQGNLAGRARLRSDLSERPSYPPRGLILSTGEQRPPGQSLAARLLVVEVNRAQIDVGLLTAKQQDAGHLPHAMSGYLLWLANRLEDVKEQLPLLFAETRHRVSMEGEHLRIPEALANLWLGFHFGIRFCEDVGACSKSEADELSERAMQTLLTLGRSQAKLVEQERPTRRFLSVLLTLVTQGKAMLLRKDRSTVYNGRSEHIGWQDDEFLYLIPNASYQLVARFCRDSGEGFATRDETLRRDMFREGILEPDGSRFTRTVRFGSTTRKVLQLWRSRAEDMLGEQFPSCNPTETDF